MKGRIKMYNSSRGFGFIAAEDENDYFFHISDVKTIVDIARGMLVTFEKATGPKGPVAKEIRVTSVPVNQPEFLAIGNTRIRIRDIRDYCISSETFYEDIKYFDFEDFCTKVGSGKPYEIRYLEITTYKDSFSWSEREIDVDEEFERIDKILNGGQSQNF